MQGTWVSTVPRLGESKAWGSKNPVPTPKQNWGEEAQFGSRETWQRREDRSGEQQAGLPRSPEKRGRNLKALTQGPKGSLSSMQHGRGDTSSPGP